MGGVLASQVPLSEKLNCCAGKLHVTTQCIAIPMVREWTHHNDPQYVVPPHHMKPHVRMTGVKQCQYSVAQMADMLFPPDSLDFYGQFYFLSALFELLGSEQLCFIFLDTCEFGAAVFYFCGSSTAMSPFSITCTSSKMRCFSHILRGLARSISYTFMHCICETALFICARCVAIWLVLGIPPHTIATTSRFWFLWRGLLACVMRRQSLHGRCYRLLYGPWLMFPLPRQLLFQD